MVLVDNVHLFHCSFLLDEDALLYEDAFRLIFQCRLLQALLKVFSGYFKFSVLFFSSSISSAVAIFKSAIAFITTSCCVFPDSLTLL